MNIQTVSEKPSMSPSMRREWIEIACGLIDRQLFQRLPPCGGSGLKWEIVLDAFRKNGLPPCGGSGLKYVETVHIAQ